MAIAIHAWAIYQFTSLSLIDNKRPTLLLDTSRRDGEIQRGIGFESVVGCVTQRYLVQTLQTVAKRACSHFGGCLVTCFLGCWTEWGRISEFEALYISLRIRSGSAKVTPALVYSGAQACDLVRYSTLHTHERPYRLYNTPPVHFTPRLCFRNWMRPIAGHSEMLLNLIIPCGHPKLFFGFRFWMSAMWTSNAHSLMQWPHSHECGHCKSECGGARPHSNQTCSFASPDGIAIPSVPDFQFFRHALFAVPCAPFTFCGLAKVNAEWMTE